MRFNYIESRVTNPCRNLAFEEALLSRVKPDEILIFLWQNENTIVIGRNQDVYRECRAGAFLKSGGRIARRRSGGGAVYHDLGNLNFSIISHRKVNYSYQEFICAALDRLSVKATFNGRNDMMVGGRKFSGNAAYMDGDMVCQHGTILVNSNVERMTHYLTPEESKLSRNHIRSISSRVVNLCDVVAGITVEGLKKKIVEAVKAVPFENAPDKDAVDGLEAFYESDDWIYCGRTKEQGSQEL